MALDVWIWSNRFEYTLCDLLGGDLLFISHAANCMYQQIDLLRNGVAGVDTISEL